MILQDFQHVTVSVENSLRNNSITTNFELEDVAQIYLNHFIGVFSSDTIPELRNTESCIINTKPKKSNGEHWCALYCDNGKIFFYDSYKRPYVTLSNFWRRKKWIQPQINQHPDESEYAQNCGQLCIAAIYVFEKYGCNAWFLI